MSQARQSPATQRETHKKTSGNNADLVSTQDVCDTFNNDNSNSDRPNSKSQSSDLKERSSKVHRGGEGKHKYMEQEEEKKDGGHERTPEAHPFVELADLVDGKKAFRQTTPDGIELKKCAYGYGMYATKPFAKGSTLYVAQQLVIPNEFAEFKLYTNHGEFDLDTETHSVQFSETKRWLYLFDSFMNHSCDPNTISRQTKLQAQKQHYSTVALKDINAGDEITCDYNLFEYDCHGKVIEQCLCGADACIGRIEGFRYLNDEEMKRRYQLCDASVLHEMALEPSNQFYYYTEKDMKCPTDCVDIDVIDAHFEHGNRRLLAARDFAEGETVYYNKCDIICPDTAKVLVEVKGVRVLLNRERHCVNIGDGKCLFYFFDTFQNHHCDPNTMMKMDPEDTEGRTYETVSLRAIKKGEELTTDYDHLVQVLEGRVMACDCGSANCKGFIKE